MPYRIGWIMELLLFGSRCLVVLALNDTSRLSTKIAQVIQLRTTNAASAQQLDGVNLRGVQWEATLDADAEAHLANHEGLAKTSAGACDHNACEGLDTGIVAFCDVHIDLNGISRAEIGNRLL